MYNIYFFIYLFILYTRNIYETNVYLNLHLEKYEFAEVICLRIKICELQIFRILFSLITNS